MQIQALNPTQPVLPATVSQTGTMLLIETARQTALDQAISTTLSPWHCLRAAHDVGKTLLTVALAATDGGHCLADVGVLRPELDGFGPTAPIRLSPG